MFESLPGFRDFYPEQCAARNHLFRIWRQTANSFGFSEYDAPVLEPLDLFREKSGPEVVSQLFAFTDKGGREVALRPEMTPSLARLAGAKAGSLRRPIKWFHVGEHYRYEKPQRGRLRAFYQFNADILGEPGPAADAELIALCIKSLTAFGLSSKDFRIRLSDRDIWLYFIAGYGIEGEAAARTLEIIDKRERVEREVCLEKLGEIFGGSAEDFLKDVEKLAKATVFESLNEILLGSASIGSRAENREKIAQRMEDWKALLGYLEAMGLMEYVQIDLGIVRGLAYYTGFVFEAFECGGKLRSLAGGGRYDRLVQKLGYGELPASGFAMGDVTLCDLLSRKNLLPGMVAVPDIHVILGGAEERATALSDILSLRELGLRVEYPLKETGFGKQFKQAGQSGARYAMIYGSEELAADSVKIRDMKSGGELLLPRSELKTVIIDLLETGIPKKQ